MEKTRRLVVSIIFVVLEVAILGWLLIRVVQTGVVENVEMFIGAGLLLFILYVIHLKMQAGKVEKKAFAEKLKAHTIIDYIPFGIALVDEQNNILKVNSRVGEICNMPAYELIGKNLSSILTPESMKLIEKSIFGRFEVALSTIPKTLKIQIADVKDQNIKILILYPTLTEQTVSIAKKVEKKPVPPDMPIQYLRLLWDSVKKSVKTLENLSDGQRTALIETLIRTRKMYNYYDVAVDKTSIKKEQLNICTLVKQIADDFRELINLKKINVEFDMPEEIYTRCDKELTKRALEEVFFNSVCYVNDGGLIKVSIMPLDGEVKLSFFDNGIGVLEDDLVRVFEKGYLGSLQKPETKEGRGYGLSLAKTIIEAHTGNVLIEGKKDAGTKVSIILPKE
jgi:nitrogen fixation/metabolism regulation signal transduction histidine kinase